MPFLTRWDDDSSRPSIGSALRDAAVRAVLPGVAVFAVIVGIGWVIMEPLRGFEAENGVSRWFQDRRTPTGETVTKFMSMIGNTEYVIAVGVLDFLFLFARPSAARRLLARRGDVAAPGAGGGTGLAYPVGAHRSLRSLAARHRNEGEP